MEWTVLAATHVLRIAFRSPWKLAKGTRNGWRDADLAKELGRGLVQASMWTRGSKPIDLWCGSAVLLASAAAEIDRMCVLEMAIEVLLMRAGEETGVVGPGEAVLFGVGAVSLVKATVSWAIASKSLDANRMIQLLLNQTVSDMEKEPWVPFQSPQEVCWHTSLVLLSGLGILLVLGLRTSRGGQKKPRQGLPLASFLALACWSILSFLGRRPAGVSEAKTLLISLLAYSFRTRTRIICCTIWLVELLVLVPVTFALASTCRHGVARSSKECVVSCWRKAWHVLLMCMLLPVVASGDILFVGLALAYVALAFVVLNFVLFFSKEAKAVFVNFTSPFLDGRDQGNIIFSHVSLVASFGIPIWILSMMWVSKDGTSSTLAEAGIPHLNLFLHSGMLTVGVGDTLAAIVGCFVGKTHLFHNDKTLEGSLAAIIGMVLYAMVVNFSIDFSNIVGLVGASVSVAIVELMSVERDNTMLPVVFMASYWLLNAIMQPVAR